MWMGAIVVAETFGVVADDAQVSWLAAPSAEHEEHCHGRILMVVTRWVAALQEEHLAGWSGHEWGQRRELALPVAGKS
jgi:hypothetical protein